MPAVTYWFSDFTVVDPFGKLLGLLSVTDCGQTNGCYWHMVFQGGIESQEGLKEKKKRRKRKDAKTSKEEQMLFGRVLRREQSHCLCDCHLCQESQMGDLPCSNARQEQKFRRVVLQNASNLNLKSPRDICRSPYPTVWLNDMYSRSIYKLIFTNYLNN